jgi:hypothetical protein
MGVQVVTSINFGTGEDGVERLRLYKELAKKRGYDSLSAFIVDLVDKEGDIHIAKPKRNRRSISE